MTSRWNRAETLRWLDRLLVAQLICFTLLLALVLSRDTDIWWHLKAGQQILSGAGIPYTDTYTFGAAGRPWIDLHWGFQIIARWIFDHWGSPGLTAMTATAAVLAVSIGLVGSVQTRSVAFAVICWVPAVLVMSTRFFPRPEMFTLVLLAVYLGVLNSAAEKPSRLWWLVPAQLVWVNVQGLFILGPVLLGCWLLDPLVWRTVWRDRGTRRPLVGATVGVGLACLANPYGWHGALFPLTLFRRVSSEHDFYGAHIGELMGTTDLVRLTGIGSFSIRWSLVLVFAAVASFVLLWRHQPRRYFRLFAFAVFTVLGLLAVRNLPQFAIVAGAVLAWNLGDWLATGPEPPFRERLAGRLGAVVLLFTLLLWARSGGSRASTGDTQVAGLGEYPLWNAHEAARFVSAPDMPPYVLAYHEGQAALVEFYMRPDQRVFLDPRLEVVPRSVLEEYYDLAISVAKRQTGWSDRLARLPQPLSILADHASHGAVEATLLTSREWRCVWFDALAGVYVPASARELVERHGVDFGARHFGAAVSRSAPPSTSSAAEALVEAGNLLTVGQAMVQAGSDVAGRDQGQVLLLLAMDKAREVLVVAPQLVGPLRILAAASQQIYADPLPATPVDDWHIDRHLGLARTRFLLQRMLTNRPDDFDVLLALFGAAQQTGDADAQWAIGARLRRLTASSLLQYQVLEGVERQLRAIAPLVVTSPFDDLPMEADQARAESTRLLAAHRYTRAQALLDVYSRDHGGVAAMPPDLSDRFAWLTLLAGAPEQARAIWRSRSTDDTAPWIAAERVGSTQLVEGRYADATDAFRRALELRSDYGPAHYGLTVVHLEQGDAKAAVSACPPEAVVTGTASRPAPCGALAALASRYRPAMSR